MKHLAPTPCRLACTLLPLLTMTSNAQAIPQALSEFDTFTVSITGPGLDFLTPTGVFSGKTAEANGTVDQNPTIGFPFPLPVADNRIADVVSGNASAEAKQHDFNILSMVFKDYTAQAQGNSPAYAFALGTGILDFVVNGDPGIGDSVTIGYSFTGAHIIADDGVAWMSFNIFGGLDFRKIRINEDDPIMIDPVTIDLQRYEGGESVAISVIPKVYAAVPEPSLLLTGLTGLLGLVISGRKRAKVNQVRKCTPRELPTT